jgi:hypothetical protein
MERQIRAPRSTPPINQKVWNNGKNQGRSTWQITNFHLQDWTLTSTVGGFIPRRWELD